MFAERASYKDVIDNDRFSTAPQEGAVPSTDVQIGSLKQWQIRRLIGHSATVRCYL